MKDEALLIQCGVAFENYLDTSKALGHALEKFGNSLDALVEHQIQSVEMASNALYALNELLGLKEGALFSALSNPDKV